jgi:hypothetical protein
MSGVFRNIDPPPPHRPASVYSLRLWCGGRTHSPGGEGVGVHSSEDARHRSVLYICKYSHERRSLFRSLFKDLLPWEVLLPGPAPVGASTSRSRSRERRSRSMACSRGRRSYSRICSLGSRSRPGLAPMGVGHVQVLLPWE